MKKRHDRRHYTLKEGRYFEDFIFAVLDRDNIVFKRSETIKGISQYSFDAVLPKGLPGFTDKESLLEIKYTNAIYYIQNYIKKYDQSGLGKPLIIITLISDNNLLEFESHPNVVVLGASYLLSIINKYPEEWWVFVASCSDASNIYYDSSDHCIHIKNPPLASNEIGKEISLDIDDDTFYEMSYISESDFIKRIKKYGNPAIFVGNGVSIDFGSDSWNQLSDSLFDYLVPKYIDDKEGVQKAIGDTNYSTTSMSKYMIDPKKYSKGVYYSIYRKYEKSMHLDNTLVRAVVKIKNKKPNMPLITYNYDTYLELDYMTCFSSTIDTVTNKKQSLFVNEPRVIHIHGLVPYNNVSKSSRIILTQEDYYSAYKGKTWVSSYQKGILRDYTCIFVGSSMSDLFQMSVINDVKKKHYSIEAAYSWKCFALLCLKNMSAKDKTAIFSYYLSKGVHIIVVDDFKKMPEKLLSLFGM